MKEWTKKLVLGTLAAGMTLTPSNSLEGQLEQEPQPKQIQQAAQTYGPWYDPCDHQPAFTPGCDEMRVIYDKPLQHHQYKP